MRGRLLSIALILALLFVIHAETKITFAQEIILHSFNGNNLNDGSQPFGGVAFDNAGNLYGTTFAGGTLGYGTVYKLTPGTTGWSETLLWNFNGGDGWWPKGKLIFDAEGNIYSTTWFGGFLGYGGVFELSPDGGSWTFRELHSFNHLDKDAINPSTGLVRDSSGNYYGNAPGGGLFTWGAVYEVSPDGYSWSEKLLHSFNLSGDGSEPFGELAIDGSGNLYGTTGYGGESTTCFGGCGTVFELSPQAGGEWTYKILHNFNNNNGANPFGGLLVDATGNLYGMTTQGGTYNYGSVFKLSPSANGWKETILHNFNSNGVDGNNPSGALVQDGAGNLYGATGSGGVYNQGTVFELSQTSQGGWKETILHSFNSDGVDGMSPGSGISLDSSGNLYGTTEAGGVYGQGTIYEVMH
jgi:uncharacterized repeat protein (TIGR03803 family)